MYSKWISIDNYSCNMCKPYLVMKASDRTIVPITTRTVATHSLDPHIHEQIK